MATPAATVTSTPVSVVTPAPVKVVGAPKTSLRQWGLDYGRFLQDDYLQKKFLTVKYTGKGNTFNFNGKQVYEAKDGFANTSNEVKLITNCHGKNFESKFDSKGLIRLWANWGSHNIGKPVTFITKVKTSQDFKRWSGSLAAEYSASNVNFTTRLDVKQNFQPYLSEKIVLSHDRFKFGIFTKLNLQKFGFRRYNAFAQYSTKEFDVFLEHVSPKPEEIKKGGTAADFSGKYTLGKLILASIFRWKDTTFIARLSYRPHKHDEVKVESDTEDAQPKPFRFVFGHITKINNKLEVRGKIDSRLHANFAIRHKCSDSCSIVASTQVKLRDPGSFLTGKTIPIPLGLGLEFSYN